MWPNQGPPMMPYNPAYPGQYPAGVYPQGVYPGYPVGQYPAMAPVVPGVMPVPVVTDGCTVVTPGAAPVVSGFSSSSSSSDSDSD